MITTAVTTAALNVIKAIHRRLRVLPAVISNSAGTTRCVANGDAAVDAIESW